MAGVGFYMTAGEIALVGTTAKTIIEVTAGADHRVRIDSIGFFFDSTAVTNEPVVVELIRIGTTGTGSAGTPEKLDPDYSETLEVDFKSNMSVEPTGITVLKTWNIHPQSGYEVVLPLNRPIWLPGSDLIGIRCTAPDAVNVIVNVEGEE